MNYHYLNRLAKYQNTKTTNTVLSEDGLLIAHGQPEVSVITT